MKRSRTVALLSMGAGVLTLTACSGSETLPAKVYASIEECVADGTFRHDQCKQALFDAQDAYEAAYPKFETVAQCEQAAGEGKCEADRPSSRDQQWRPSMVAFLIANSSSRVQSQPVLPSTASASGYSTSAGVAIARSGSVASLPASAAARPTGAQVARAVTTARGGFGSNATVYASSGSAGGAKGGG